MLHTDILNDKQVEMVKLVQSFARGHYLVGGTALALQLGHRRSVDFDLFTKNSFDNDRIIGRVEKFFPIQEIYTNQQDQLTIMVNQVKMTWYRYEYEVETTQDWEGFAMPDPLVIGAMKAFAMGRRAKWKDYVDMYFLIKKYSLAEIVKKTETMFGEGLFDEVLLRAQLSYYDDIDYREEVEYMPGWEVSVEEVKEYLAEVACTE